MSEDERKKPFKIGQLFWHDSEDCLLVLDIKWDSVIDDWRVTLLSQQSGERRIWRGRSLFWLGEMGKLRKV